MNKFGLILLLSRWQKVRKSEQIELLGAFFFMGLARFSLTRRIKLKKWLYDAKFDCVCVCVSKLFGTTKYKALKVTKKLILPCNFLLL